MDLSTRQLAERVLCRRSLLDFTRSAWDILEPGRELVEGWIIEAMCEHLEAVTRGEIQKLLINVPPGSMKSLLVRVFWPAWEWTTNPTYRYYGFSYAQPLSVRDNRRARMVITSPWYQTLYPEVQLAPDQATKVDFANIKNGWMKVSSVTGQTTGERGDRVVVDDPHNVLDADSDADRETTLRWFNEALPNRVNDLGKSAFVIVMQRVHHEDVSAAALAQGYEHLLVPMHYDSGRTKTTSIGWKDPRTKDGELMWSARFSEKNLDALRDAMGEYAWAAQYDQTPTPRSGGMFEVDKIGVLDSVPDEPIIWSRAWDLAGTDAKGAFTAGVRAGWREKAKRVIIADVRRDRKNPFGVRAMVEETAETDGKEIPIVLPQDPGQAGKAQVQSMTADLAGYVVKRELQSGTKEARAEPLASQVGAGNVDIVRAPWNKAFLNELRHFPLSTYKDQVDAASSAFNAVAPHRRRKSDPKAHTESVKNRSRIA